MNTDSRFWGFSTVCRISLPTTFREPLWVSSSMVNLWPLKMGPTAAWLQTVSQLSSLLLWREYSKQSRKLLSPTNLRSVWYNHFVSYGTTDTHCATPLRFIWYYRHTLCHATPFHMTLQTHTVPCHSVSYGTTNTQCATPLRFIWYYKHTLCHATPFHMVLQTHTVPRHSVSYGTTDTHCATKILYTKFCTVATRMWDGFHVFGKFVHPWFSSRAVDELLRTLPTPYSAGATRHC